ncbi:MAG: glycosyltransferase family 4 protein [Verrucomicrobiae bacterium]|nr:glycosyltransferase family 4 protein [Verrucomicrobiae bacterium]NNJ44019.1 glycosyltransferase family 4 protein [Akkermansiaceae bacterium]
MKIAIISTISGYSWGGTEEVWRALVYCALSEGHQVMLCCDHRVGASSQVAELIDQGMEVSTRPARATGRVTRLLEQFGSIHQELGNFDPDVVMVNAGSPFDLHYDLRLAKSASRVNCPLVYFCHFNSDRLHREIGEPADQVCNEAVHWVFVSEGNRDELERQTARSFAQSTVILNQSRLELDAPLPLLSPQGSIKFAHVARLETRWKGQDLLPAIFATPKWRERDVTMDYFGTGPDEGYIQSLIEHYHVAERVGMVGYERDLVKLWESYHALLLPSRGEGTPLVAIEAMMCGRPVITTDVGGNSEIIEDGVTGFIAEAPTVRSFESAMERAWQQREDWAEIGRRAHFRARELAKADPAGQLLQVLQSIVKK